MSTFEAIHEAVLDGNSDLTVELIKKGLDEEGLNPQAILDDGLFPAMSEAGQLFEDGEFYIPELLVAARAMKNGLSVLQPRLCAGEGNYGKKIHLVIGTVQGDIHDIGKNLVVAVAQGSGMDVVDLGVDVAPEKFVAKAKELLAAQKEEEEKEGGVVGEVTIGISALLTTTMVNMKGVIEELKKEGIRDKVKVVVGGAPLSKDFADQIGADGYSKDANSCVQLVRSLA